VEKTLQGNELLFLEDILFLVLAILFITEMQDGVIAYSDSVDGMLGPLSSLVYLVWIKNTIVD
jgi:hypothetical protein